MGRFRVEPAVQADMEISIAVRTYGFPREELVDIDFFAA
jgi:hypothetical protein